MDSSKSRDFGKEILNCLGDDSFGMTVSDIATKIDTTRNTVYRYLGILEGKELVFKKKIGRYVLYFTREPSMEVIQVILPIYRSFMNNLKNEFPDTSDVFKRIGRIMVSQKAFPIKFDGYSELESIKNLPNKKIFEEIRVLLPFINLFDNKIQVKIIEYNKKVTKAIYQIHNSTLLENDDYYLYHFSMLSGYIEEKFQEILEKEIQCDVLEHKIIDKKRSFINISIEID